MTSEAETFLHIIKKKPLAVLSLSFSKPATGASFVRVKIHPAVSNNDIFFYAEEFTADQVFHRNIKPSEVATYVLKFVSGTFRQAFMETEEEILTLLTAKKGKQTLICKKKPPKQVEPETKIDSVASRSRNRVKNYLIPEGNPVPFLVKLGVMNAEGKVLAAKYDKFRQINRFLEFIDDILQPLLAKTGSDKKQKSLSVIDFGCGKSYLTFAAYHFLTSRGIEARIVGLDRKKNVIEYCNELASECGYGNLRFFCADIASFDAENAGVSDIFLQPDLAISLHACDTATDYTLAYAVQSGARVILAAPCCQHELNADIDKSVAAPSFSALLEYGIVKERFSALATDVMRAGLLESAGYKTQILEFIDAGHTPKNLLIRAVKKSGAVVDFERDPDFPASYIHLRAALGCAPLLEKLLWQKK